ncbi:TolC family protein [Magnetococcales bacterium HHB-1]
MAIDLPRQPHPLLPLFCSGLMILFSVTTISAEDDTAPFPSEAEIRTRLEQRKSHIKMPLLQGRTWQEISLEAAFKKALKDNIGLKRSQLLQAASKKSIIQNEALFDTTLNASATHSRYRVHDRTISTYKYKPQTTACTTEDCGFNDANEVYQIFGSTSPVRYLEYDQVRPAGYYSTTVKASEKPSSPQPKTHSYTMGVNKPLPWGMALSFSHSTTYKETYWSVNADSDSPISGRYGRPWIASFLTSFSTPVPGSKYFGQLAVRETTLEQAKIAHKVNEISLEYAHNDLLLQVAKAYWDLVSKSQTLGVTIINAEAMKKIFKKNQILFENKRITPHEYHLAKASLTRLENEEVIAWNRLIQASDTLNRLLSYDPSRFYLPKNYEEILTWRAHDARFNPLRTLSAEQIWRDLESGFENNPSVKNQVTQLKTYQLTEKQAKQQIRPEMSLQLSLSGSQSNAVYGYEKWERSMFHLFDPDSVSASASLSYNYSWKNRKAKANLAKSTLDRQVQQLTIESQRRQVALQVKTSWTTMASALRRLEIAENNLQLSQSAFREAQERYKEGFLSNYELIEKNLGRLAAWKQRINARIIMLKAEADLNSALALLPPELTTNKAITHARVQSLLPKN